MHRAPFFNGRVGFIRSHLHIHDMHCSHTHEEIDLLIALTQQHELLSRITHVVTSAITIKLKGAPKLIY